MSWSKFLSSTNNSFITYKYYLFILNIYNYKQARFVHKLHKLLVKLIVKNCCIIFFNKPKLKVIDSCILSLNNQFLLRL